MQLDLTNCQLKFGFFPPVKGVGMGGQFSSKIDTKENMLLGCLDGSENDTVSPALWSRFLRLGNFCGDWHCTITLHFVQTFMGLSWRGGS